MSQINSYNNLNGEYLKILKSKWGKRAKGKKYKGKGDKEQKIKKNYEEINFFKTLGGSYHPSAPSVRHWS